MFQIAAAYALAKRHSEELIIPSWTYGKDFGIQTGDWQEGCKSWFDQSFNYTNILHTKGDRLMIRGLFQSEKYFEDCKSDIAKLFLNVKTILPGCCAVHVRRGDYVGNPHFAQFSMDYYIEAMALMPYEFYVFFSDDIEFCMKKFSFLGDRARFSTFQDNDVADLRKIAGSDAVIMSNSTFAWWGAWLSGHNNVVAPKRWFDGPSLDLDTSDLIPERWIRI